MSIAAAAAADADRAATGRPGVASLYAAVAAAIDVVDLAGVDSDRWA